MVTRLLVLLVLLNVNFTSAESQNETQGVAIDNSLVEPSNIADKVKMRFYPGGVDEEFLVVQVELFSPTAATPVNSEAAASGE